MIRKISLICACAVMAACAKTPDQITATYISPTVFSAMNCSQMNEEANRINQRLASLTGAQQTAADNDATLTAVSIILFWPAAFFINGGADNATEIANLRGQAEGLAAAAAPRGCS